MSTSRPSSAALDAPRTRRPARAVLLLLALLALLLPAALAPAPARAEPPASVEVTDTTRSVDPEILEHRLAEIDFRTEVRLVVLVLDVTEHDLDPADDRALNDAVLDHARSSDPSLLSADGSHWADGTVILALDPENRFLGSYGGEDVKLTEEQFADVQDAMRDPARDGEWDRSVEAGAEEYAALLLRPWWQRPAVQILAGTALVLAGGWVLILLGLRRGSRERADRTRIRHDEVLARRALTDAAGRTLPDSSPYAQAVVRDHERYTETFAEAEQLREQVPTAEERSRSWGLRGRDRDLVRRWEDEVEALDAADDRILAAADLLHRMGGWRGSWELELLPLRDSLKSLGTVRGERGAMSGTEQVLADRLLDLGEHTEQEMTALTARLEADEIDPDSALEELDTLTRELSAAVAALTRARIDAQAEDDEERALLEEEAAEGRGRRYRSLRALRAELEGRDGRSPVAGEGSEDFWRLSPVAWYSSWHGSSGQALSEHRNPTTSSSSTSSVSGYSPSSGGGFSGAGSSSRF